MKKVDVPRAYPAQPNPARFPKTESEAIAHLKSIGYFGPNTQIKPVAWAVRKCYG